MANTARQGAITLGWKQRKCTAQRYAESSGGAQLKMKTIKQKYN